MGVQKTLAIILGVVLLLVGVIGFFNDPILGFFNVNALHNIIHLITGAIFLWAGLSKGKMAKPTNKWLGIIYIIVAIVGFIGLLTFLEVYSGNDLDNWLHLVIGVISIGIGWFSE